MATVNKKVKKVVVEETVAHTTHAGGPAIYLSTERQLRRSVLSALLWEDSAYESGITIADRIKSLVPSVAPLTVAKLAVEARTEHHLRHVPLLLARELARHPHLGKHPKILETVLDVVIQRPDELAEYLAIYWKDGKCPISAQSKKGLAKAFTKFDEYQLQKWDKTSSKIRLRDVWRLVHPRTNDPEQRALWQRMLDDTLNVADTWETALSAGDKKTQTEKKAVWLRLLDEKRLPVMAFLKNLRNMLEAGISVSVLKVYLSRLSAARVLPFRFVQADRMSLGLLTENLDALMLKNLQQLPKLKGKTLLLVDVSGSMWEPLSGGSALTLAYQVNHRNRMNRTERTTELTRLDAAAGVAIMTQELCEDVTVLPFHADLCNPVEAQGLKLVNALWEGESGGTRIGHSISEAVKKYEDAARIIVITDEQSQDAVTCPKNMRAFMINVAPYAKGVGYGDWIRIDGWSESCVRFIQEYEEFANQIEAEMLA